MQLAHNHRVDGVTQAQVLVSLCRGDRLDRDGLVRLVASINDAASEANLDHLTRAGGHYIAGERMRSGAPLVEQALSRQGRHATVPDNLRIKEVRLHSPPARRFAGYKVPAPAVVTGLDTA